MTARKTAAPKIAASEDTEPNILITPEPIDTRQYETLNERVNSFHSCFPDGRIVLEVSEDAARISVQATVYKTYDADDWKGNGFARVASGLNADMIAQDLAIGRALANAGLRSGERQTKEEKEYTERLIFPRLAAPEDDQGLTPRERRERRAQEAMQENGEAPLNDLTNTILAHVQSQPDELAADEPEEEVPFGTFGCTQCSKPITAKQKTGSMKNFGIALCAAHERETRRNVALGE